MSGSAYTKARDEKLAAEVNVDRHMQCPATGCPNRWSVSGERGRACSAHYWSEPRDWPRITQQMLDAQADLARRNSAAPRPPVPTLAEKLATLAAAAQCLQGGRTRLAWAHALRERHQAGARLTREQVQAYRQALYCPDPAPLPPSPPGPPAPTPEEPTP